MSNNNNNHTNHNINNSTNININNINHNNNSNQQQQLQQNYQIHLNQFNYLLAKQHQLQLEQQIYTGQLSATEQYIQSILYKQRQKQTSSYQYNTADLQFRNILITNQKQITRLLRKLQGQQILPEVTLLKSKHQKYVKMISNDYQNTIQQRLSTVRGDVDQMKKKVKEINKDILTYQQVHIQEIEEYRVLKRKQNQMREQRIKVEGEIQRLKGHE